jgi:hypothetical protein
MNLDDEKRRLSAAWLNIVAAGLVSTGVVAPLVAQAAADASGWRPLAMGGAVLAGGFVLHLAARALLGRERGDRSGGPPPPRRRDPG